MSLLICTLQHSCLILRTPRLTICLSQRHLRFWAAELSRPQVVCPSQIDIVVRAAIAMLVSDTEVIQPPRLHFLGSHADDFDTLDGVCIKHVVGFENAESVQIKMCHQCTRSPVT